MKQSYKHTVLSAVSSNYNQFSKYKEGITSSHEYYLLYTILEK